MNNKQLLGALALDLKRVALGYFRGSTTLSNRFLLEVVKRKKEIDSTTLKPYLQKLLGNIENLRNADDALLYSTLFQNAAAII